MNFSVWLQDQLNNRQWSQSDLVRHAKRRGYKISSMQVSRILSGDRKAGPDACIAISAGLGLPREKVFRARGWLLSEPQKVAEVDMSPAANEVVKLLGGLSMDVQESAARALKEQLKVVYELVGKD